MGSMGVRDDCRHYLHRSTQAGEAVQRCRLSANLDHPFSCPDGCLFFETRVVSGPGWTQPPSEPMSNTAEALNSLPVEPRKKRGRKRR
jgi:hypothetical protein